MQQINARFTKSKAAALLLQGITWREVIDFNRLQLKFWGYSHDKQECCRGVINAHRSLGIWLWKIISASGSPSIASQLHITSHSSVAVPLPLVLSRMSKQAPILWQGVPSCPQNPETHLCSGCSVRLQAEFDPMLPSPPYMPWCLFEGWVLAVRCSGVVTSWALPMSPAVGTTDKWLPGPLFWSIGAVFVFGEA